jgi:hypothetical protein
MIHASNEGSEARFAAYVEALGAVLGHADRQEPMRDYCLGLLMPIERKDGEGGIVMATMKESLPRQLGVSSVRRGWSPACGPRRGRARRPAVHSGPPIRKKIGQNTKSCGRLLDDTRCRIF